MTERLWNWLAHVTCPDVYAPAPRIVQRVRWWWMQWWGWAFFYSEPWRPGSARPRHDPDEPSDGFDLRGGRLL